MAIIIKNELNKETGVMMMFVDEHIDSSNAQDLKMKQLNQNQKQTLKAFVLI